MKRVALKIIVCIFFLVAILDCRKPGSNKVKLDFEPINRKTISYDYFLGTWYLLSFDFGTHLEKSRYLIISRVGSEYNIEFNDEQGITRFGKVYESENLGDKELIGMAEPYGKIKICITNSIEEKEDGAISIILYDAPEPIDFGTFQKNKDSIEN